MLAAMLGWLRYAINNSKNNYFTLNGILKAKCEQTKAAQQRKTTQYINEIHMLVKMTVYRNKSTIRA